jgi:hypothetical protein
VDRALRRAMFLSPRKLSGPNYWHRARSARSTWITGSSSSLPVKAAKNPGVHVLKMMKIQYVFLVSIVSVVVAGCVTETTRSRPMASTTDQTKKRVHTQEELQKTGQTDTASALQKVDPSIQTSGPH